MNESSYKEGGYAQKKKKFDKESSHHALHLRNMSMTSHSDARTLPFLIKNSSQEIRLQNFIINFQPKYPQCSRKG